MLSANPKSSLPSLVQSFFCERLVSQRNASPRTVSSYRDTVRLLLRFASARTRRTPAKLTLADLDAPLVLAFLDHLEKERGNSGRTRNARLAALRSLVKHIAVREPVFLAHAESILAIPMKRFDRPALTFLSLEEVEAIAEAPDASTRSGRRDRVLFLMFYNTGARVSELAGLKVGDVSAEGSGSVRLHGKGRKERTVPLWKSTVKHIREWLRHIDADPASPFFPNRLGVPMSRSGVEHRLRVALKAAGLACPSLKGKSVSPHTFRHTTAMHLLKAGVDLATIALWMGHESPATTHTYIEADLDMKEAALDRLAEPANRIGRYKASDAVLAFLESL